MFWIYVLAGAVGFVALVPAMLRAVDQLPTEPATGPIGFGATTFALSGLLLERFALRWLAVLICALALGFAAAAIAPEILKNLRGEHEDVI